ncbi:MAG: succinate dehydrogenase, cytochrome b556 subunit [Alphaproteobacteria bacterium]|nr:succinate dehydrogenase, cytochrome b556 subunit [Alphaproteobacteria bacterium]
MAHSDRPLSPHLQVYRWQITMTMSILHRVTGVGLGLGALLLAYWLIALASGPDAYDDAQWLFGGWIGRLVLLGFTWALAFHLCNGIRHLFWDAGKGFALGVMRASGWTVVVAAVILTVAVWILGYVARGTL